MDIGEALEKLRSKKPLVHNITNLVVTHFTANLLLAAGASPIMAHAAEEVAEIVSIADALVLNIGTLDREIVNSMLTAGHSAAEKQIPIILDPVGAGASKLRTESALKLLDKLPVTVLRGNASEILSLAGQDCKPHGVDSKDEALLALDAAKLLANRNNTIVAVTGKTDYVVDERRILTVKNGHPIMRQVTGTGCGATAIVGAFCAICENDYTTMTAYGLAFFEICAERAARQANGPGTFQAFLLDELSNIEPETIKEMAKIDEV